MLIESLEPRRLLSGVAQFGDGFARSVRYTDVNGQYITVSMVGGSGTITFGGTGDLLQSLDSIVINSGGAAKLTVATSAESVDLKDVTVNGALANLQASKALLHGSLSGDLAKVQLAATTDGAVISDTGAGTPLSLKVRGVISNTQITGYGDATVIRAQAMSGDCQIAGKINTLNVKALSGDLTALYAGTIHAGSMDHVHLHLRGASPGGKSINLLQAGDITDSTVQTAWDINTLHAKAINRSVIDAGTTSAGAGDTSFTFANTAWVGHFSATSFDDSALATYSAYQINLGHIGDAPPTHGYYGVYLYDGGTVSGTIAGQPMKLKGLYSAPLDYTDNSARPVNMRITVLAPPAYNSFIGAGLTLTGGNIDVGGTLTIAGSDAIDGDTLTLPTATGTLNG